MYGHVVALLVEAIKDLESQLEEKTTSEEKTKEIDDIKASLKRFSVFWELIRMKLLSRTDNEGFSHNTNFIFQ